MKKGETKEIQRKHKVRLSDAKAWLIKLQQVDGRGYSSIRTIRGGLRLAFQMAEKFKRTNIFAGIMKASLSCSIQSIQACAYQSFVI